MTIGLKDRPILAVEISEEKKKKKVKMHVHVSCWEGMKWAYVSGLSNGLSPKTKAQQK